MDVFVDPEKLKDRRRGNGGVETDSGEESEINKLLSSEDQDEEASFFEIAEEEEEEEGFVVEFEKRRPAACVLGFLVFLSLFTAAGWLAEDVEQKRLMREALSASLLKTPFQYRLVSAEEKQKQQDQLPQAPDYTIDAWTGGPSLLKPGGVSSWNCVCSWLLQVVGYITSTGMVANLLVLEKIIFTFKRGGVDANNAESTKEVVARVWNRQELERREINVQEMSNSRHAYGYSIVPLVEQLQQENQFSPTTTELRVSLLLRDNSDNAAYAIVTFTQGPTAVFEVSYNFFITVLSLFTPCILLLSICLVISVIYLFSEIHVYRLAKKKLLCDYLAGKRSRPGAAAASGSGARNGGGGAAAGGQDLGDVSTAECMWFYFQHRYVCLLTYLTAFVVALLLLLRLVLAKAFASRPLPSLLSLRILDAMEDVARLLGVALTCLLLLRLLGLLAAASSSFSVLRNSLRAAAQEFLGVHSVVILALIGTATANHLVLGVRIAAFDSFGQSVFHTVSMAFGSPLLLSLPPVAAAINIFFITCWWMVLLPMLIVVLLFAVKHTVEKSRRLTSRAYNLGAEIPEQLTSCMAEYFFCCTPSLTSLGAFNELRRMRHLQPLRALPDAAAAGQTTTTPASGTGAAADAAGGAAADKGNESSLTYKEVAAAAAAAHAAAAAARESRGREGAATAADEGEGAAATVTATRVQLGLLLGTAACFCAFICLLVDSPRLSRDAAAAGSRALLSQPFLSTDPLSTTATLQTVPPLWLAAKPAECTLPTPKILLPLPREPVVRLTTLEEVTSLQGIYDWIEKVLADRILNAAYATPYGSPHAPLANPGAVLELRRVQLTCRYEAPPSVQLLSPVSRSGSLSSLFSTLTAEAFGVGSPPPFTADEAENVYRVGLFFTPNPQLRASGTAAAEAAAQQQRTLRTLLGSGEVVEELLLTQDQFAALLHGYDSVQAQAAQLREKAFLDYQMRSLAVSWMSYNGDSDVYLLNKIQFDMKNSGGLRVRPCVDALPGWTLSRSPSPPLPFALLILSCVLFLVYLVVSFAATVSEHLRLTPGHRASPASASFISLDVPLLLALAFFCFFYSVLFTSTLNPGWLLDTNSDSLSSSSSSETEGAARFRRLASATTHAAATPPAAAAASNGDAPVRRLPAVSSASPPKTAAAVAPAAPAAGGASMSAFPAALAPLPPTPSPSSFSSKALGEAVLAALSPSTTAASPPAAAASTSPAPRPLAAVAPRAAFASPDAAVSTAAGGPAAVPVFSAAAAASASPSAATTAGEGGEGHSRRLGASGGGKEESADSLTLPSIVPGPVQPWPWVPGSSGGENANFPPPTAESLQRFLRLREEIENKATRLWNAKLAAIIFLLLLALRALTLTAAVPHRLQHARKLIELLYDTRLQLLLVGGVVFTVFLAFSLAGFVLLGNEDERFSSPVHALLSCLLVMTSRWNFNVAAFPTSTYASSSSAAVAAGGEEQPWRARWKKQQERKIIWWGGAEAYLLLLCLVFFCCLNYLLLAFLHLRYAQLKKGIFLQGEQEDIKKFCTQRVRMAISVNNLVILYWKAFIKALQLSIRSAQEAGPAASVKQQAALLRDEFFQEFRNLPLLASQPTTSRDRVERSLLATLLVRIQQYLSDMLLLKAKQHLILIDLHNLGEYQKQLHRLNKKKNAYINSIERALGDVNEEIDRLEATLALLSYAEESTVPDDSLLLLQRHRQQQLMQLREGKRPAADLAALEDVGVYVPPEKEGGTADPAAAAVAAREERIREWREKVEKGLVAPPSPLHKIAETPGMQHQEEEQKLGEELTHYAAAAAPMGLLVDDVSVPPPPEQVWLLQQQARAAATSPAAAAAAALRDTRGTTAATAAAATAAAATARAPGDPAALPPLQGPAAAAAKGLPQPRLYRSESLDTDEAAAAGATTATVAATAARGRRSSSPDDAGGGEDWTEIRRIYGGERQPTLHFYEGKGKEAIVRSAAEAGHGRITRKKAGRSNGKGSREAGEDEYGVIRVTVPPPPIATATAAAKAATAATDAGGREDFTRKDSGVAETAAAGGAEEAATARRKQPRQTEAQDVGPPRPPAAQKGEKKKRKKPPKERGGTDAAADSSYSVLSPAALKKKKERRQKAAAETAGGAFGVSILGGDT